MTHRFFFFFISREVGDSDGCYLYILGPVVAMGVGNCTINVKLCTVQ
jgi:hypothetical protein